MSNNGPGRKVSAFVDDIFYFSEAALIGSAVVEGRTGTWAIACALLGRSAAYLSLLQFQLIFFTSR